VAAGQCLIALGTQTGGSIIRPASYCGVCGFKPAHDPRWLEGVMPVSAKLDHVGPMARSIHDLELAWGAIVDRGTCLSVPIARLGVLRDYFWEHASPAVRAATDEALHYLGLERIKLVDVPLPPDWETVHAHHRAIMAYDCARYHAARFESSPQLYEPQITGLIKEGLQISSARYGEACDAQQRFREKLFAAYPDIDALVTPATTTTAPLRDTTGDPRFNSPWSFAGVPAVCFPCGLASDGMPCGLQLVRTKGVSHDDEFHLLAVAALCESLLAVNHWPQLNQRLEKQFPYTAWTDPPC
jgi:aspartyl-tRNA(Asn)/glutamyl-tRNA(Gln) amidotransferase subunit A